MQELREAIANLFNPAPNPIPETDNSGHGWCKTVAGKEEVFLSTSDVLSCCTSLWYITRSNSIHPQGY
ncbi:MAG: hypothetical protein V7K32_08455 [Nostoc sp.]|uniref:hypothetical protein n=1 Tax=Nostoc sp. TaxID=1180 RepID=UPI002FF8D4BB